MQNLSVEVEFEPERVFFIPPWNRNFTVKEMIANYRADHPENMVLAEKRLRPWLMTMSAILFLFFSFIFYKAVKISDEILYGQLPDDNKVIAEICVLNYLQKDDTLHETIDELDNPNLSRSSNENCYEQISF